jgi:hypothetical protein
MPDTVSGIHVFLSSASKTWVAGSSGPAMATQIVIA